MLHEIIFAGFGGQGILTMGQIVAYGALDAGLETSWIPAYGPESRGGTSNCTMVISDQRIANPMTSAPSAIIVMNEPSFTKFVPKLKPGGVCVANRDLITSETSRTDIDLVWVDANQEAKALGNLMTAGNIALGALNARVGFIEHKFIEEGLGHVFSGKKTKLIPLNMGAYMRGVELLNDSGK
jgi:2-oxoglutarate ferredoxin oxidoreductase subunit gamma